MGASFSAGESVYGAWREGAGARGVRHEIVNGQAGEGGPKDPGNVLGPAFVVSGPGDEPGRAPHERHGRRRSRPFPGLGVILDLKELGSNPPKIHVLHVATVARPAECATQDCGEAARAAASLESPPATPQPEEFWRCIGSWFRGGLAAPRSQLQTSQT